MNHTKASFVPMDTFPIEGDPLPKKADGTEYDGWLLNLDEMTSAPRQVQAAAYKLILDREVGLKKLHPRVRIIAAGNREQDNAITVPMSTAMQSRMAHFELEISHKSWVKWAEDFGIDQRIMAFLHFKPQMLNNFKPDHTDHTYASPRTWEFCNRLLKKIPVIESDHIPLIASVIDEAAGREFYTYCKIYKSLVTIPQILADPENIPMPDSPGTLYALSGSIGTHIDNKNADRLMTFVERMPIEFQALMLQQAVRREIREGNKTGIRTTSKVRDWMVRSARELF